MESFQKAVRTEMGLEARKTRKDIYTVGTANRGMEARRVEEHEKHREPEHVGGRELGMEWALVLNKCLG